jgi:biotin carboxyl carrier protein
MKKGLITLLCMPILILALEYEGILFPSEHVVLSTLSTGVVITLGIKEGQFVKQGTILLVQDPMKDSLGLILSVREKEKSRIQKTNEIESDVSYELKSLSYEDHFIRAPFSGTIVKIIAKKYEYYSTGTKVIEIADLSNLITEIAMVPAKLEKLKQKNIAITVFRGNEKSMGQFYAFNPLAEPGVEQILVKILIKNTHRWFPGASVKVVF